MFTSGSLAEEIYKQVTEDSIIKNKIKAHFLFCFKMKKEYRKLAKNSVFYSKVTNDFDEFDTFIHDGIQHLENERLEKEKQE